MTQLDRRDRAADLTGLIHALENYRDQRVDLDLELAKTPEYATKDLRTKQAVVLRLCSPSSRNWLNCYLCRRRTVEANELKASPMGLPASSENCGFDSERKVKRRCRCELIPPGSHDGAVLEGSWVPSDCTTTSGGLRQHAWRRNLIYKNPQIERPRRLRSSFAGRSEPSRRC
jgi:hypothetical protein